MNDNQFESVNIFNPDIDDIFAPLFSPELWSEIDRSFRVLEEFAVPDLYDKYTDLMSLFDTTETDTIKDMFYNQVRSHLYFVLHIHSVQVDKAIPLPYLNELCEFFLNIQHLQTYEPMFTMFNGYKSDEEIFFELLTEHTCYPDVLWAPFIESVDPVLLEMIKNMAEQKLGMIPVETDKEKIALKTKAFKNMSVFGSNIVEHALGVQMACMQMLMGLPLATYINLSKENLLTNPDDLDLALDFLSLCLISKDMDTNPYTLWSTHNDTLGIPLTRSMKIANHINDKYVEFTQFLKVSNE